MILLGHLESFFAWLLTASWQASVLAVLVLAAQYLLGARLNPRWRHALWLLVVLRLLLPSLPESAFSLFRFAPPTPPALEISATEPLFVPAPVAVTTALPEAPLPPAHPFTLFSLLALIWLAGATALAIATWMVNRRFALEMKKSAPISIPEIARLFAETKAELKIRRSIRLVENGQVRSPAIMGLFTPTLLLPDDVRSRFDATELRLIFLHELAHLKRGDLVVQALIALLQIVHWFNPVLWFAFRRLRIDREPATDALVLSRAGEAEKERYGLMLIKLLEHFNQRHSLATLVGILEDTDQFKRRISLIARFTRGAYGWSVLGVVLIVTLAAVCLTKGKVPASNAAPPGKPIRIQVIAFDAPADAFTGPHAADQALREYEHTRDRLLGLSSVFESKFGIRSICSTPLNTRMDQAVGLISGPNHPCLTAECTPHQHGSQFLITGTLTLNSQQWSGVDPHRELKINPIPNATYPINLQVDPQQLRSVQEEGILEPAAALGPRDKASRRLFVFLSAWPESADDSDAAPAPIGASSPAPTAGQVEARQPTAPSQLATTNNPSISPDVRIEYVFLTIPEKDYQAQHGEIDALTEKGDYEKLEHVAPFTVTRYSSIFQQIGIPAVLAIGDDTKDYNASLARMLTQLDVSVASTSGNGVTVTGRFTANDIDGTETAPDGTSRPKILTRQTKFSEPLTFGQPKAIQLAGTDKRDRMIVFMTPAVIPKNVIQEEGVEKPDDPKKPGTIFHLTLVEVNDKAYAKNQQAMDDAVKNGDRTYFLNQGAEIVRETPVFLRRGQKGWYSEGQTQTFVDTATQQMKDGKAYTNLTTQAEFIGLYAGFSWSADETHLNTSWKLTAPGGYQDVPNTTEKKLVMHETSYKDSDWNMVPGQVHGYWVGEDFGWTSLWAHRDKNGGTIDKLTTQESPHRLAVFITATPVPADSPKDGPPATPKTFVRTSLQVFELGEADYQAHQADIDAAVLRGDVGFLSSFKSFDSITSLPVLTKPGEQGVLEAVSVLPFANAYEKDASGKMVPTDMQRRNLGTRMVFQPEVNDGKITLNGQLTVSWLKDWIDVDKGQPKPVFGEFSATTGSETFTLDETKGFQFLGSPQDEPIDPRQAIKPGDNIAAVQPRQHGRMFYILQTKLVDNPYAQAPPPGNSSSAESVTPSPASTASSALSQAPAVPAPHSDLYVSVKIVGINENEYQAHRDQIDTAVRDGDAAALTKSDTYRVIAQPAVYVNYGIPMVLSIGPQTLPDGSLGSHSFDDPLLRIDLTPTQAGTKINFKGRVAVDTVEGSTQPLPSAVVPKIVSHQGLVSMDVALGETVALKSPNSPGGDSTPEVLSGPYFIPSPDGRTSNSTRLFFFLKASPAPLANAGAPNAAASKAIEIANAAPVDVGNVLTVRTFLLPDGFPGNHFHVTMNSPNKPPSDWEDVKEQISGLGIHFPTGASANFVPSTKKLVVRNTPGELDHLQDLIAKASAAGSIQIEIRVAEISDDFYQAHKKKIDAAIEKADFGYFNNLEGVSTLSAPIVTTKPGIKANVDIVREFPFPTAFDGAGHIVTDPSGNTVLNIPPTPREFVTKDLGISAEVTPFIAKNDSPLHGKIVLNGTFSVIEFEGNMKSNLGPQTPTFETRETHFFEALDDNQQIGLLLPGVRGDEQVITDKDNAGKTVSVETKADTKRLILFLGAKQVE